MLVSVREALFQTMGVTTGAEAIELMTYSNRTMSDLRRVMRYRLGHGDGDGDGDGDEAGGGGGGEESASADASSAEPLPDVIALVVRSFVSIPIACEFRGFVENGTLNAISQYYRLVQVARGRGGE